MPFTFSHPAIVIPLKKLKPEWFSITGLVTGSMSPDFMYFLKMDAAEDFGHTLMGIFLFDLPISYVVGLVFHLWVRNPLIRHLPAPLDEKYTYELNFDFRKYLKQHWFLFGLSVLLGAASHLFWDQFTRPEGWVFDAAPSFFGQIITIDQKPFRLYVLIERAGSVFGLLFIIGLIFRHKGRGTLMEHESSRSKILYWLSILFMTAVVTGIRLGMDRRFDILGHVIVVGLSAALYALVFVSALYPLLQRKS